MGSNRRENFIKVIGDSEFRGVGLVAKLDRGVRGMGVSASFKRPNRAPEFGGFSAVVKGRDKGLPPLLFRLKNLFVDFSI